MLTPFPSGHYSCIKSPYLFPCPHHLCDHLFACISDLHTHMHAHRVHPFDSQGFVEQMISSCSLRHLTLAPLSAKPLSGGVFHAEYQCAICHMHFLSEKTSSHHTHLSIVQDVKQFARDLFLVPDMLTFITVQIISVSFTCTVTCAARDLGPPRSCHIILSLRRITSNTHRSIATKHIFGPSYIARNTDTRNYIKSESLRTSWCSDQSSPFLGTHKQWRDIRGKYRYVEPLLPQADGFQSKRYEGSWNHDSP